MVKVFSPLMSLDASGTIGNAITFSKWKGRNYVRRRVIPSNPRSELQLAMRAGMGFLARIWGTLTPGEQTRWSELYASLSISGINSLTRFNQPRVRGNKGVRRDPALADGATPIAATSLVAVQEVKSILFSWDPAVVATNWAAFVYLSLNTGFVPGPDSLVAIVPIATQQIVVPRLLTGTPYFLKVQLCEEGGALGTPSAQATATPL